MKTNEREYETMLHSAVRSVNHWYELLGQAIDANDEIAADEFGTKYENVLEYYSRKLGISYNKLEDIATDVRFLEWDYN